MYVEADGTALSNAAYKGFTVIVAMLLKAGADVNLSYPLHASLASLLEGNETCVLMLIQAGADIDKVDDRGRTPMQIVVGHEEKMKRSWDSLEEKQKADPEFKAFMATRLDFKESYYAVGIDFPLGDYHRKYRGTRSCCKTRKPCAAPRRRRSDLYAKVVDCTNIDSLSN